MKNLKIIDKTENHKCYKCSGTGNIKIKKCDVCKGTGKWKEEFYHLITETPDGQNIAFGVDNMGK